MAVLLRPTEAELINERKRLLGTMRFSLPELLEREYTSRLTIEESGVLRRLKDIAFLLGEDD